MTEGKTVKSRNDWGAIVSIAKTYFHLLNNQDDREDLVSAVAEGWSVGLSKLDCERGIEERTAYLWTCGKGYARNYIRGRVRNREFVSGLENAELEPFEAAVERYEVAMAKMMMGQRMDEVLKVVETLPTVERVIIERRYFMGETFRETAEAMGVTRQRVDQVEKRALKKLRGICNPNAEG